MRSYPMMAIVASLLVGCSSQPSQMNYAPPAVPVLVTEGEQQDVPIYFESLGVLKPAASVEIRPQVSGMLKEVHFQEGQLVKAGHRLFTVDPEPYLIKLQEVEAQRDQNMATLESSRKKLQRYQNLSKQDLISQLEWDELQSQVAKNEAILKADEAKVAAAKRDLSLCIIRAPMDGRAGEVNLSAGNLVSASQTTPLMVLTDFDDLAVEFTLTEREFQQLTADHVTGSHPIEIYSYCKEAGMCKGVLTFLNNSFNTDNGLLVMHGNLNNDQHLFLPGQTVKVRLPITVLHDAIVIPQKAVKINQNGPYVFVVKEDNTVEMRQLQLGNDLDEKVVVSQGLTAGEKIVTEGHLRLAPGINVIIQTEEGHP